SVRQRVEPVGLRFGLQVPTFDWPGGPAEARARLSEIGRAAEDAGFESIWVMDHYRQIPMFGPAWHDMLEGYTTLAFLAAHTERGRLGTLVAGITPPPAAPLGGGPEGPRRRAPVGGVAVRGGGGGGGCSGERGTLRPPPPRHSPTDTRCSKTRSSSSRCTGGRALRHSKVVSCASRRPCVTRARCRTTSRSSSVATVNVARFGSRRGTQTHATS